MENIEIKIGAFCRLLETDQLENLRLRRLDCEGNRKNASVSLHAGTKYFRVDIGTSGRYMVDIKDGNIYGIKAYGKIHKGHHFGTLDTINDWEWGGYRATPKGMF